MKSISEIWFELRQLRNLPLIITVVISFSVAILNLTEYVGTKQINSLILTLLSFFAFFHLKNRLDIRDIKKQISQSIDSLFLSEFPQALKEDIRDAKELWLIGVTLTRTIKTYRAYLEKSLRMGRKVKILLIHPDSAAAQIEYVEGSKEKREIELKRATIVNTLDDLCQLKKVTNGNLELRVLQHPLSFGARLIDPETNSGSIYIEHYPYKADVEAQPVFVLKVGDSQWYEFFKDEINALWEDGLEWNCEVKNE